MTISSSLLDSFQEVMACAIETKRNLKIPQQTFAVSNSQQRTLTGKVSSLTEKLSLIYAKRANDILDVDEMMTLVQQITSDYGSPFSSMPTKF